MNLWPFNARARFFQAAAQAEADIIRRLDVIEAKLDQILANQERNMTDYAALQASIANVTSVDESAVKLIQGISSQLSTLQTQLVSQGADASAVAAMKANLDAATQGLAAAVAANTPAAPAPSATADGSTSTGTNSAPESDTSAGPASS